MDAAALERLKKDVRFDAEGSNRWIGFRVLRRIFSKLRAWLDWIGWHACGEHRSHRRYRLPVSGRGRGRSVATILAADASVASPTEKEVPVEWHGAVGRMRAGEQAPLPAGMRVICDNVIALRTWSRARWHAALRAVAIPQGVWFEPSIDGGGTPIPHAAFAPKPAENKDS